MVISQNQKEILAVAYSVGYGAAGGARLRRQQQRGCSIHLYFVLRTDMKILGISAFYHDSAAALIEDGKILSAAQEERFTRKKHDPGYPGHAIDFCISEAKAHELDAVVFYEKPFIKFERLLETYFSFAPRGFSPSGNPCRCGFMRNFFKKVS